MFALDVSISWRLEPNKALSPLSKTSNHPLFVQIRRMSSATRPRPSSSTGGPSGEPKKRQLPPPTTFTDMAITLVLHVCRKYLFMNMSHRIGFYIIFVTALSFFGELAPLPRHFYLTNRRNVLNDVFVKWGKFDQFSRIRLVFHIRFSGLLWTLAFLSPFVYYTSKVYSGDDLRNIRQQMARLIVSVVLWFLCTGIFGHVERISGFCTKSAYPDRSACAVGGGRWLSFDVSGHCFLLIYCCLMIEEETRVYRNWDRITDLLNQARSGGDPVELMSLTEREKAVIREKHEKYTLWIRLGFLALTLLHLLWDFMVAITSLYYHNWPQKIAGVAVATAAWYLTYGLWYRMPRSPGMPGHSKMKYQRKEKA